MIFGTHFSAEYALETAQQQAPGFLKRWEELLVSNKAPQKGGAFVPKALVLGVHLLVNFPFAKNLDIMLLTMANVDTAQLEELYVNALPRSVDLPLFWSERQFDELQGCEEARRAMQHGSVASERFMKEGVV